MTGLSDILEQNEEWLMERILMYAKRQGYAAYTSTLREAWRLSISGLSASIIEATKKFENPPELHSDEDLTADPVARFGIVEAQRHRERGVSLGMFLGLMKYYRQTYLDLIDGQALDAKAKNAHRLFFVRVFDRIEIGFCVEWSGGDAERALNELQISNRLMTNEKNKYLTIFESIPNPVIILNRAGKIDNMNLAAARLFRESSVAGGQYYCPSRDRQLEFEENADSEDQSFDPSCFGGSSLVGLMPWVGKELSEFVEDDTPFRTFEKVVGNDEDRLIYRISLSKSLDISDKFGGTIIILEDITSLKQALEEVKTLKGFVPICSSCKKIRDDQGFWQQVEKYVQERSEAQFSHSICPECFKSLYPEFATKSG